MRNEPHIDLLKENGKINPIDHLRFQQAGIIDDTIQIVSTNKEGVIVKAIAAKPSIIPDNYDEQIKQLRQRLGMSQVKFAEFLGVSFASVNRWENRQTRPSNLAWIKINSKI